jgi:hypothetical protein
MHKGKDTFIDISLIGGKIRVTSKNEKLVDLIKVELRHVISDHRSSADVIVEFTSEIGIERFLRALDDRSNIRCGAKWRNAWSNEWKNFDTSLPILPPFRAEIYFNRFTCLHAAIIGVDTTRGIIICGDRGSGKTTSAIWATRYASCTMLSDEVTLIEHATLTCFGLPIPIGVFDNTMNQKIRMSPDKIMPIHNGAITPVTIVVLSKSKEAALKMATNNLEAFEWVLPHLRSIGTEIEKDILCLKKLCARVKVYNLMLPQWPELEMELDNYLNIIVKECQ